MIEPQAIGSIEPDTQVTGIRHSPCGRILAAPCFDQSIRRWDLSTLAKGEDPKKPSITVTEMAPVRGHDGYVSAIDFHPQRTIAYSADSWGRLKAWPYLGEKPAPLWNNEAAHDGWLRDLAVSADGDWLATCGRDRIVRRFASAGGELIGEFGGHEEDVFALAVHPSGKWIVSGDLTGRVIQWDTASGKIAREFDATDFHLLHRLQDIAGLRQLKFDADGKTLIAAGSIPTGGANVRGHGRVRMWDFESGEVRHDLPIGEDQKDVFAHDIALHPSGFLAAVTTGQPGSGSLILQRPGEAEAFFSTRKGTVNCHGVSLSPDGRQLAVSATNARSNGNGRRLDDEGRYPANHSPIHLFELVENEDEKAAAPA